MFGSNSDSNQCLWDGINWFLEILFYRLNQYMSKASYIFSWFSLLGNQPFSLSKCLWCTSINKAWRDWRIFGRQLEQHKDQMMDLMRASQGTHFNDLGYFYLFLWKNLWQFAVGLIATDLVQTLITSHLVIKDFLGCILSLNYSHFIHPFGPVPECPCLFCHLKMLPTLLLLKRIIWVL